MRGNYFVGTSRSYELSEICSAPCAWGLRGELKHEEEAMSVHIVDDKTLRNALDPFPDSFHMSHILFLDLQLQRS